MRSTKPSKEFMFFYGLRLNSPFYTTFLHFFNRPTDRLKKVDIEAQLTELTILTEQNRNKGNKNFLNRLSGYVGELFCTTTPFLNYCYSWKVFFYKDMKEIWKQKKHLATLQF